MKTPVTTAKVETGVCALYVYCSSVHGKNNFGSCLDYNHNHFLKQQKPCLSFVLAAPMTAPV